MDDQRWIEAWKAGRTAFHRSTVNEILAGAPRFLDAGPHRVLVPLCGKSLDLAWLRDQGHDVVGIELSDLAVDALFQEAGLTPDRVDGDPPLVRTPRLSVFQGDFFAVTPERLRAAWSTDGPVRVWDRAAMIALPPDVRGRYVAHLRSLAGPGAVVLLDTIVYDQALMAGPPFSVPEDEVRHRYAGAAIEVLTDRDLPIEARWAEAGLTWMRELVYRITL